MGHPAEMSASLPACPPRTRPTATNDRQLLPATATAAPMMPPTTRATKRGAAAPSAPGRPAAPRAAHAAHQAAVLRRDHNITRAKDIRRRIDRRLDLWEEGKVEALVEDAIATAMRGAGRPHRQETDDTVARRFDSMIGGRKYRRGARGFATAYAPAHG